MHGVLVVSCGPACPQAFCVSAYGSHVCAAAEAASAELSIMLSTPQTANRPAWWLMPGPPYIS